MTVLVIQPQATLDHLVTLLSGIPSLRVTPYALMNAAVDPAIFAGRPDLCIIGAPNFAEGQTVLRRIRSCYPSGVIIGLMSGISKLYRRSWLNCGADIVLDESLDIDLLPEIIGTMIKFSTPESTAGTPPAGTATTTVSTTTFQVYK